MTFYGKIILFVYHYRILFNVVIVAVILNTTGDIMKLEAALKNLVSPRFSKVFIPWLFKNPRYLANASVLMRAFRQCESTRQQLLSNENLLVPPVMILSITNNCNLQCQGCFVEKLKGEQMTLSDWQKIINQAKQLGVFAFLIAGGEPFLMKDLLDLIASNKDRVFAIFTNGTCINNEQLQFLKKTSNLAIVLSLEGDERLTNQRRGEKVYKKVLTTLKNLSKQGVLSGISITVTKDNYEYWMVDNNIDYFIELGAKLCFFIEYIGAEEDGKSLTTDQRQLFRKKIIEYKDEKPIFIIHSPGDEEPFGGCVSAGRGFIHVNALGDLTPCPITNVSTHNMRYSTLKEGLKSQLFREIRDNKLLEDGKGPCSLISHRDELEQIVRKVRTI